MSKIVVGVVTILLSATSIISQDLLFEYIEDGLLPCMINPISCSYFEGFHLKLEFLNQGYPKDYVTRKISIDSIEYYYADGPYSVEDSDLDKSCKVAFNFDANQEFYTCYKNSKGSMKYSFDCVLNYNGSKLRDATVTQIDDNGEIIHLYDLNYSYNSRGLLTDFSIEDPSSSSDFFSQELKYDGLGRLEKIISSKDSLVVEEINYKRNSNDLLSLIVSSKDSIIYGYNSDGKIEFIEEYRQSLFSDEWLLIQKGEYLYSNLTGSVRSIDYENDTELYNYDSFDNLTSRSYFFSGEEREWSFDTNTAIDKVRYSGISHLSGNQNSLIKTMSFRSEDIPGAPEFMNSSRISYFYNNEISSLSETSLYGNKIYPNPTENYLFLDNLYLETSDQLLVFSIDGKVSKNLYNIEDNRIDVTLFKPGLYFCKFLESNTTFSFIKILTSLLLLLLLLLLLQPWFIYLLIGILYLLHTS